MSYYIQLTQEERYHISVLCKEGFSKTQTAKKINRHVSCLSQKFMCVDFTGILTETDHQKRA
jgi:IS30 family transposase